MIIFNIHNRQYENVSKSEFKSAKMYYQYVLYRKFGKTFSSNNIVKCIQDKMSIKM